MATENGSGDAAPTEATTRGVSAAATANDSISSRSCSGCDCCFGCSSASWTRSPSGLGAACCARIGTSSVSAAIGTSSDFAGSSWASASSFRRPSCSRCAACVWSCKSRTSRTFPIRHFRTKRCRRSAWHMLKDRRPRDSPVSRAGTAVELLQGFRDLLVRLFHRLLSLDLLGVQRHVLKIFRLNREIHQSHGLEKLAP